MGTEVMDDRPLRLLISDRAPLGCDLLARSLKKFRVFNSRTLVEQAMTSDEIIRIAAATQPDVALISAALMDGELAGFRALPQLRMEAPNCSAIMLFDNYDLDLVVDAFRASARGVFFRAEPIEMLVKCIDRVRQGQTWVDANSLRAVLDRFAELAPLLLPTQKPVDLTAREMEIAKLVAAGLSNRSISRRLNLSEHTVKNHLFRIFDKTGVTSRLELAVQLKSINGPENDGGKAVRGDAA
ncbi:MAG TPA: response regulator transcription factor [Terriglobales bacterium]